MISVVIPCRNAESTIRASIDSVLNQGFDDLEIICVINGCTDATEEVIQSVDDRRVSIVRSSPGIVPALNAGIRESRGEFIARQDADDVWLPGKLDAQMKFLDENDNIDVIGTQMRVVDIEGNHLQDTNYPLDHESVVNELLSAHNAIGHPSVVFRKRILDKCAGYLDLFPLAEDMDLWLRCIPWYKISNLRESFVRYTHTSNPKYDPRVPQTLAAWYRMIYGVNAT